MRLMVQSIHQSDGPAADFLLHNAQMMLCQLRHLRKMRDAQYLMLRRDLLELFTNNRRGFTTYICIDLIKNKRRDLLFARKQSLDRQHDSRELATTGAFPQRHAMLAHIWSQIELDFIIAVAVPFLRNDLRKKFYFRHV